MGTLKRLLWTINQSRGFKRAAKYLRPFFSAVSLCRPGTPPKDNARALRRIAQFKDLLGDVNGRTVFVHSSADGLGMDVRGVPALIDTLVQWVGENGHVLMPVFAYSLGQRRLAGEDVAFDIARSPVETGIVPDLFRRKNGVRCSMHPTHSVAAYGRNAGDIVAHHHEDIRPFGERSPFYQLVRANGMIIGLGVDWYRCLTSMHVSEDLMKDEFRIPVYWKDPVMIAVRENQAVRQKVRTLVHNNHVYQYMDLLKLRKYLLAAGAVREYEIGRVPFFAADARMLNDVIMSLARQGITAYD